MILIGVILLIVGIALMRFLTPKEDVRLIQLELWPKVIALLIAIAGIILLIMDLF